MTGSRPASPLSVPENSYLYMTETVAACIGIDRARIYVIHTHIVHGEVVLLLLLQMLLQLKEMVVAD